MNTDVFILGTMLTSESFKLEDYLRYYLDAGIPTSRIIIGIRHDYAGADSAAACQAILTKYDIPFSQELDTNVSIADWRQSIQDEYITDADWVVHANIGELVHIPWAGNDFHLAATFLDQSQFDAVDSRIYSRYMRENADIGAWYRHPISVEMPGRQMVMTRGYWYTCDDGNLCPEFCDSAWVFNHPVEIHRLTYSSLSVEDRDRWRISAALVD
jgi:hypothetical protein